MAYKKSGDRYRLGEPLNTRIAAFCDALSRAPEIQVIREALTEYIDRRLAAEQELRRRFDEALRVRIGEKRGGNVVVLPGSKPG